jgi:hypothetical protein
LLAALATSTADGFAAAGVVVGSALGSAVAMVLSGLAKRIGQDDRP